MNLLKTMALKLKHQFQKLLHFLRLTNSVGGRLSLTNTACIIVLTKVALAPDPSFVDLGSLLAVLALYYGKKHITKGKDEAADETNAEFVKVTEEIAQLRDKVSGFAAVIGIKGLANKPKM